MPEFKKETDLQRIQFSSVNTAINILFFLNEFAPLNISFIYQAEGVDSTLV